MDCGNPHLSFGPLVARQRPQPSTPVSPDTCVRRADSTPPQPPCVPRTQPRMRSPEARVPPLLSRRVSGSAGWRSGSHWPSVGTRLRPQSKGLEPEQNGPCVSVVGGRFQKSEANPPCTAWGKRQGRGRAASQSKALRCLDSIVANPVMREAGCVFNEPSQKLGSRCADSPPRAHGREQ